MLFSIRYEPYGTNNMLDWPIFFFFFFFEEKMFINKPIVEKINVLSKLLERKIELTSPMMPVWLHLFAILVWPNVV